jgi:ubiquinone biosynthesis protein COQ4
MKGFENRHDFASAGRALQTLLRDPDDTKQAFRVIEALGGPATERMYRRFARTALGGQILRERRQLLAALKDTAKLEALPEGSVGRAYLDFLRSQELTAAGLVSASENGTARDELDPEHRVFADRLRDMHDLWHVVTGYRGDLVGEAAVLAFSFAQTKNPGVGLIAFAGFLKLGVVPGGRKLVAEAFARGVRAKWLVAVDWEALLARPLADVRRELGIDAPPTYDPIYSTDPRAQQAIASS